MDRSPAEADISLPLVDTNLAAVVHSPEVANINPAVLGINPVAADRSPAEADISLPLADTNLVAVDHSREAADINPAVLGINQKKILVLLL